VYDIVAQADDGGPAAQSRECLFDKGGAR